jgi:hypothetical protein
MAPHDFAAEPAQARCSLQRLVQKSRDLQIVNGLARLLNHVSIFASFEKRVGGNG